MFCPKCAAQNVDDAKFCRACGADISLVPQAVTGHLGEGRRHRRHRPERVTIEHVVPQLFMGVAFLCVALAIFFWGQPIGGKTWWFWMLIPAFSMFGRGVALYLRMKEEQKRLAPPAFAPAQQAVPPPPAYAAGLPARDTGEIIPPPSVTEGTTRHLGVPVERGQKNP